MRGRRAEPASCHASPELILPGVTHPLPPPVPLKPLRVLRYCRLAPIAIILRQTVHTYQATAELEYGADVTAPTLTGAVPGPLWPVHSLTVHPSVMDVAIYWRPGALVFHPLCCYALLGSNTSVTAGPSCLTGDSLCSSVGTVRV